MPVVIAAAGGPARGGCGRGGWALTVTVTVTVELEMLGRGGRRRRIQYLTHDSKPESHRSLSQWFGMPWRARAAARPGRAQLAMATPGPRVA